MTTTLTSSFTLTDDELQVVGNRIGVQSFPVVLAIRPRHATHTELDAAFDAATTDLTARGLIVDGLVAPDLISVIRALQRPHRELSMRLVTPEGTSRVSVVRNGRHVVLARRVSNEISLRELEGNGDTRETVQALLRELPAMDPAPIDPVGAPIEALREALYGTHDAVELSDKIRALGADPRAAMVLGSAMASRVAFAEVVYHCMNTDDDRVARTPAAVGVFYTKRGRLVSAPSVAPNGNVWATVKGGSNHALAQSMSQLMELLPGGWEGNR